MTGTGQATVPARVLVRRLRESSRPRRTQRGLLVDFVTWAGPAGVGLALVIGVGGSLIRLLTQAGWALPGARGTCLRERRCCWHWVAWRSC